MNPFFEKAQVRIAEIVHQLLTAERELRKQTWPEHTQFMWGTDEGWEDFLEGESAQKLKIKYEAAAWQLLFCETVTLLSDRIEALEKR